MEKKNLLGRKMRELWLVYRNSEMEEYISTRLHIDSDGKLIGASNAYSIYSGGSSVDARFDLFDTTEYYFDEQGKLIGASNAEGMYSGSSKFKTSTKNYMNYSTEIDMKSKYPDYDNYSPVEKLQARQYDYEKRLVSDMYDRGVTNSFSMPSIFAKVSMIAEIVFDNFCLIMYHYCGVINNRY